MEDRFSDLMIMKKKKDLNMARFLNDVKDEEERAKNKVFQFSSRNGILGCHWYFVARNKKKGRKISTIFKSPQ